MQFQRFTVCTMFFLASAATAIASSKQQKKQLIDNLNHSYSFTTNKSTGSLYTIHITGLSETPTVDEEEPVFVLAPNQPPKEKGSALQVFTDTHGTREVQPGDQFFLMTLDVNERSLVFHLCSLDTHSVVTKGTSNRQNFILALEFPLAQGAIDTLTAEDVHKLVDPVLSLSSAGPASIQLGQSEIEVKQILGNPDQEIDLDSKHILVFKKIKVVFVNGKAADIE